MRCKDGKQWNRGFYLRLFVSILKRPKTTEKQRVKKNKKENNKKLAPTNQREMNEF